jgi:hypothetical protein
MRRNNGLSVQAATVATLLLSECMVGPKYRRSSAPMAPAYREAPPSSSQEQDGWKVIQPSAAMMTFQK